MGVCVCVCGVPGVCGWPQCPAKADNLSAPRKDRQSDMSIITLFTYKYFKKSCEWIKISTHAWRDVWMIVTVCWLSDRCGYLHSYLILYMLQTRARELSSEFRKLILEHVGPHAQRKLLCVTRSDRAKNTFTRDGDQKEKGRGTQTGVIIRYICIIIFINIET